MRKIFINCSLIFLVMLFLGSRAMAQKADAIKGIWWNEEKTAKVEIFEQNSKFFGKIIYLEEPLDENGKPKTDKENPNDKLRSRKIEGLVILQNLQYEANNLFEDGEIYDPKSGKTYSANAKLVGNDKLDLRGYFGFPILGKTATWTRAD